MLHQFEYMNEKLLNNLSLHQIVAAVAALLQLEAVPALFHQIVAAVAALLQHEAVPALLHQIEKRIEKRLNNLIVASDCCSRLLHQIVAALLQLCCSSIATLLHQIVTSD